MILGVVIQQPSDTLDYDIDVTELLGDEGDILSSVSSTVSPPGLVVVPVKISDTKSKLWVSGGTAGIEYKAEITHVTSSGRIKQDEVIFQIEEF